MGKLAVLREEFQVRRFGFDGIKSERLCMSQWRVPVCVYLGYRLLVMVYAVVSLSHLTTHGHSTPMPLAAYLTSWAYLTLTIYLLFHFIAASAFHLLSPLSRDDRSSYLPRLACCSRPSETDHASSLAEPGIDTSRFLDGSYQSCADFDDAVFSTSESGSRRPVWYLVVVWVLFDTVSALALTVTVAYFLFLFRAGPVPGSLSFASVQVHVLNSVLVLVEHAVTATPCRLLHVVYPLLYVTVYLLFSVLYWAGDHCRVIYPAILDWNKPGPTLGYVALIGFVILPLLQAFLFLLYRAKAWLHQRCC